MDENDESNIDIERKKIKALQKKSDYIMSIIECMLSVNGDSVITPQQKTIVDRCVKKCYKNYLDNDFDIDYLPTLEQLQLYLDEEKGLSEDGRLIAEGAEYYTKGSMNIFSHKSNIDYDNRMVVFNVQRLEPIFDWFWELAIKTDCLAYRS